MVVVPRSTKPERIKQKGRLQPCRMLLVDLEQKRIIADDELKQSIATQKPYGQWLADNAVSLFSQPDIDGGLIGGASLKVADFAAICAT